MSYRTKPISDHPLTFWKKKFLVGLEPIEWNYDKYTFVKKINEIILNLGKNELHKITDKYEGQYLAYVYVRSGATGFVDILEVKGDKIVSVSSNKPIRSITGFLALVKKEEGNKLNLKTIDFDMENKKFDYIQTKILKSLKQGFQVKFGNTRILQYINSSIISVRVYVVEPNSETRKALVIQSYSNGKGSSEENINFGECKDCLMRLEPKEKGDTIYGIFKSLEYKRIGEGKYGGSETQHVRMEYLDKNFVKRKLRRTYKQITPLTIDNMAFFLEIFRGVKVIDTNFNSEEPPSFNTESGKLLF